MKRFVLAAVLAAALSGAACHRGGNEGSQENTGGASPGAPPSRVSDIDNEKLIAWLKAQVDQNPGSGGRSRLINLYLKRGQMRGRLDDFERCIAYSAREVELTHTNEAYKTRARCEISLHRFHDADADLEAAGHHRDDEPAETLGLKGDVALALGKYDEASDLFRKAQRPDAPGALARLANLDVELGNLKEADLLFDAAEKFVKGKDASYEAWLQVQRALRHLEWGEIPEARARIDRALTLDGKNVLARQYDAQLLELEGKSDAAAKYEALIASTDNPEFMSALARMKRAKGDAAGASALAEQAKKRYQADLAAFPEALWQHYGQFLLDQKIEPAAAVEVLRRNAEARPNVASWIPLAWAELAAGDAKGARATIERALATPVKTPRLLYTAARVYEASGDAKKAADLRAKAIAGNPRIAELLHEP